MLVARRPRRFSALTQASLKINYLWSSCLHLIDEQPEILQVLALKKSFRSGDSELVVFDNLSFSVRKGEMLAIVGESGAGKSTLLHILGALDSASDGDVYCAQMQLRAL